MTTINTNSQKLTKPNQHLTKTQPPPTPTHLTQIGLILVHYIWGTRRKRALCLRPLARALSFKPHQKYTNIQNIYKKPQTYTNTANIHKILKQTEKYQTCQHTKHTNNTKRINNTKNTTHTNNINNLKKLKISNIPQHIKSH